MKILAWAWLGPALWAAGSLLPAKPAAPAAAFRLESASFKNGAALPPKYTCEGAGMTPPLSWTEPPKGTKSFALAFTEPGAGKEVLAQWLVYNIPPSATSLMSKYKWLTHEKDGTLQGLNASGSVGYSGPCPDSRTTRHYLITLYALDALLPAKPGDTLSSLSAAMRGHILAQAKLSTTYRRSF